MKYIFGVLVLLFSYQAVSASCNTTGCSGKVNELFSTYYLTGITDGQIYLQTRNIRNKDKLDCSLAEGLYMTVASSHPLFKEIYASLLSATALDREVHIRIKNGSSKCEVSYIRLNLDK